MGSMLEEVDRLTNLVETRLRLSHGDAGTVRLARSAVDAHLTVTHEGPAISDQDRQRMFDRFFRLDEGRSRDRGRDEFGSRHSTHGGTRMKRLVTICAALSLSFASAALAQDVPAEYQQVLTALGKQGDFKANVLKVNIPRNDVSVSVANVKTPTPFGFGGWVAMTKGTGGMDVMMGDLVLTQDEINPVMSALLDNGIEVTALHNHFLWDEPRMYYMHVHAHGKPADLAQKVKPALDLIGKGTSRPAATPAAPAAAAPGTTIDTAKLAQIVGTQGEQSGAVYKITIGRDDLKLTEMGAPINARMGLNTWAAFVGTNDNAAVAGDVAMLANEVQPVLKALRKNGLDVVAIHHHMTGTQPTIYFLHYWGTGPAEKLATGFKAALSETAKAKAPAATKP
jgi:hypothetical protein